MSENIINSGDIQDSSITNAKISSVGGSKFTNFSSGNFDGVSRFKFVTPNTANLLVNGGFDGGSNPPTGWTDLGGGITRNVDGTVFAGWPWDNTTTPYSVAFSSAVGGKVYNLRQDVVLNDRRFTGPGGNSAYVARSTVYLFGCYRYGNEPTGFTLPGIVRGILLEDSVPTQTNEIYTSGLFTWYPFQMAFTPLTATNNITLRVEIGADSNLNGSGTVYFDNFVVVCGQTSSYDGV